MEIFAHNFPNSACLIFSWLIPDAPTFQLCIEFKKIIGATLENLNKTRFLFANPRLVKKSKKGTFDPGSLCILWAQKCVVTPLFLFGIFLLDFCMSIAQLRAKSFGSFLYQ
jgi:hypothetical protein